MSSFIRAALLVAGLAVSVHAQDTALTIYSSAAPGAIPPELYRPSANPNPYAYAYQPVQELGYAVVRQEREIAIGAGRSRVRFTDVASQIDPTTVRFESLTDPEGTRVLEQSYEFDLVSSQKLLERFIDKTVTINQLAGDSLESYTGTLLSASGGIILRQADGGLKTFNGYYAIDFPALPEGLITRPTLVWDVLSPRAGQQRARVSYQTSGITWWADYNLVFTPGEDANSGLLDVGAWVSILNQSGASYDEAKLKLVAGDVHRAPQPQGGGQMYMQREMAADEGGVGGFEQKAFFEYHLSPSGARRRCRTTRPSRSSSSPGPRACRRRRCWSTTASRGPIRAGGPPPRPTRTWACSRAPRSMCICGSGTRRAPGWASRCRGVASGSTRWTRPTGRWS